VAERSVTVLRNTGSILPLPVSGPPVAFFILAENRKGVEGQAMEAELRKRLPDAVVVQVDATMSEAQLDAAASSASQVSRHVVAAFASVAAFQGNPALGGGLPKLVQTLVAERKPVALVALGNPYLLRSFPEVAAYVTTYSTVPVSEAAAVRVLFGEIPARGRLPVTIPGLAKYQTGLSLDKRH
jgi:beta-N-acetylhexosaminidase